MKLGRVFSAMCVSFALLVGSPAYADTLQRAGKIKSIFVSGGENYGFRITIYSAGGEDQLTGCSYHFAYVNSTDDNYQTKVSALLVAYAQQSAMNVTISRGGDNYCHIVEFGTV